MSDSFLSHFNHIQDPRIDRHKQHHLLDILFLSISAVLSGAEGWEDIEDFGRTKLNWLRQYRPFANGIPSHDTIARLICRLKPREVEKAFQQWIQSLVKHTGSDVVAIDGKTARRSFCTKKGTHALHTVSAWSTQHQLVLGQQAVNEKSNEITAIPDVLRMLEIENCLITIDAMGCQRDIAEQIIRQKADYVLALKGNHSGFQSEVEAWWHKCERDSLTDETYAEYTETDSGHGRVETRVCQQLLLDCSWLAKDYRWRGLQSVLKVSTTVYDQSTGRERQEVRWYISSLALDAKRALQSIRSHWQVESMHWVLDVTFREDECRIRNQYGPAIFNVMRKMAMAMLKKDQTKSASMARKKKMAALDDQFRSTLVMTGI